MCQCQNTNIKDHHTICADSGWIGWSLDQDPSIHLALLCDWRVFLKCKNGKCPNWASSLLWLGVGLPIDAKFSFVGAVELKTCLEAEWKIWYSCKWWFYNKEIVRHHGNLQNTNTLTSHQLFFYFNVDRCEELHIFPVEAGAEKT